MKRTHKLALGAVLALAAIAVGGAVAATKLDPRQESRAVIDDAARQLGVESDELSNALKQALKNRVDAAVEEGRLTREQGERMKERIDANEVPLFGLRPPGPFGPGRHEHHLFFHAKLEAAADYLGVKEAQLREELSEGKTLAQIARDRDKSVDGLVDALVRRAKERLRDDVEQGRLTEAEKNEMLQGLRRRITNLVNGRFPPPRPDRFRGFEPRSHFRPSF